MSHQISPFRGPPATASPAGLLALLPLAAAVGVLVGIVAGVVRGSYWVMVVFPILFGGVAAGGAALLLRVTKTHSRLAGAAAGLVATLAAAAAMHATLNYRSCDGGVSQLFDARAFHDCLDARAQAGVTTKSSSAPRQGTISGGGLYTLWKVEILLMVAVGLAGGIRTGAEPYCLRCRGWLTRRFLGSFLGPADAVERAISSGDVEALRAYDPKRRSDHLPARLPAGELALTLRSCAGCGLSAAGDLMLYAGGSDAQGPQAPRLAVHVAYPGDALPAIIRLFA